MQTSSALLIAAFKKWAEIFGRELSEEIVAEWLKLFAGARPELLEFALDKLTRRARRMPVPGDLTAELEFAREKLPPTHKFDVQMACPICGGSGWVTLEHSGYSFAKRCDHREQSR